jgi:hypothetical protein
MAPAAETVFRTRRLGVDARREKQTRKHHRGKHTGSQRMMIAISEAVVDGKAPPLPPKHRSTFTGTLDLGLRENNGNSTNDECNFG